MRKLAFAALMLLSAVSLNAQKAEAIYLCYSVADNVYSWGIFGHQTCYQDNWLFGDSLDWVAYIWD